ncbi:MAG TPA: VOC family protein [Bryobacteraceae bacterium]|nr:VOC family protein [Bryobacteraceae bacterium]
MSPNSAGVFAAHTHLITTDISASTAFWSAIGGDEAQIGSMKGVRMPGLYILFQMKRAGSPIPESSVGSTVEAIGIEVKNLKDTLAKLKALGVTPQTDATTHMIAVMSPERVKVLLAEDPSLATPCKTSEWLMKVPNPAEAAAWYQKWFGASITKESNGIIAQVPGMNLHFVQTTAPVAGTHGRALDHIGFDVTDLPALVTKMQAEAVTVSTPYRTIHAGFLTGLAFVTDPRGTYIELNQGYDGH